MYEMNQYAKDKFYRSQQLQAAKMCHLAEQVQEQKASTNRYRLTIGNRRIVLITFVLICSFFVAGTIRASNHVDRSETDAYYDQMVAYRLGHYYYVVGEYIRAVEYYDQVINGIPESLLARISALRDVYWYKGDALLKANQPDAALTSYLYYLHLAGDEGTNAEIDFVDMLTASIVRGHVEVEPLDT